MEGEKEREHGEEEKESDEAEEWTATEEDEDPEGAALGWQEGSGDLGWQEGSGEGEDHLGWQEGSGEGEDHLGWQEGSGEGEDHLGLPIMHWEALSLRIAELEKQDLAKPKKTKDMVGSPERRGRPRCWTDEGRSLRSAEVWEEEEVHLTELTSRLQTRVNLQLCFINDSESDEEAEREENSKKRPLVQVPRPAPAAPVAQESRPLTGLRRALRALRDKLRTDLTRQAAAPSGPLARRTLDRCSLQGSDGKELGALQASLSQAIQDLNSELVGLLQTRDQLRTEQDAMLVEVQDLTSL